MVLCLNSFQTNEKLDIVNLKILPNFTDLNFKNNHSEALVRERGDIRITYLSNFQEEKEFLKFLSLFEIFPDIQFCAALHLSSSPERKAFSGLTLILRMCVTGFVSGIAKRNVLSNSHFIFFISTYATEAQPLSLIELWDLGVSR